MGPPGLWAELRRNGVASQLSGPAVERLLENKKVAVDGAVWLYEAQLQQDLRQAFHPTEATLKVVFERCVRWLRKGVLPVIVLEGSGGGRSQRFFSRGRGGLGLAFAGHARLRELLHSLGVPSVDAEGEAEATCAALVSCGACDYVATSDCDALLFGATSVVKGLDLRTDGPSQCELWEAATVQKTLGLDRGALIAAAFLIGCDYDCRSQATPSSLPSQSRRQLAREGSGVRGLGPRQALSAARELRVAGRDDALRALGDMLAGRREEDAASQVARDTPRCIGCQRCGHGNVRKACHGAKGCKECGTTTGCLPRIAEGARCECKHCTSAAAVGGEEKVAAARAMNRVQSLIEVEPGCVDGFSAVVQQYTRQAYIPSNLPGQFAWKGIDGVLASQLLSRFVKSEKVPGKLEPLLLEWTLRQSAACPESARTDLEARRRWAADNGLQYVPITAKKTTISREIAPYVLVDWMLAAGDGSKLQLPPAARRARISIAQSCGLLESVAVRPRELAAIFSRLLRECPTSVRCDAAALLTWGRNNHLKLVPRDGRYLKSGKVRLHWCDTDDGSVLEHVRLLVSAEEAESFGCPLVRPSDRTPLANGQKTIKEFFSFSSQHRSMCAEPRDDSQAMPTTSASQQPGDDGSPRQSGDEASPSQYGEPATPRRDPPESEARAEASQCSGSRNFERLAEPMTPQRNLQHRRSTSAEKRDESGVARDAGEQPLNDPVTPQRPQRRLLLRRDALADHSGTAMAPTTPVKRRSGFSGRSGPSGRRRSTSVDHACSPGARSTSTTPRASDDHATLKQTAHPLTPPRFSQSPRITGKQRDTLAAPMMSLAGPSHSEGAAGLTQVAVQHLAPMTPPGRGVCLSGSAVSKEESSPVLQCRKRRRVALCGRTVDSSESSKSPAADDADALTTSTDHLNIDGASPTGACARFKRPRWRRDVLVPHPERRQVDVDQEALATGQRLRRLRVFTCEVLSK